MPDDGREREGGREGERKRREREAGGRERTRQQERAGKNGFASKH